MNGASDAPVPKQEEEQVKSDPAVLKDGAAKDRGGVATGPASVDVRGIRSPRRAWRVARGTDRDIEHPLCKQVKNSGGAIVKDALQLLLGGNAVVE